MRKTNTPHFATIGEDGLSASMARMEEMIRRNCPLLMRIPDHKQAKTVRTSHAQRVEIVRQLKAGGEPSEIAAQLGVQPRSVHYRKALLKRGIVYID